MWNVCLSISTIGVAGQVPRRVILPISGTATVASLSAQAAAAAESSVVVVVASLKFGRCPIQCLDPSSTLTLEDVGIRNQEKITVELAAATTKSKTTTTKTKGTVSVSKNKKKKVEEVAETAKEETESPQPPGKRTRRAAAQKATDTFAEVIRAQDDSLLQESQSQKTKPKAAAAATAEQPSTLTTNPTANRRFQAASTTGRRLGDGAVIAVSKAAKKSPRRSLRSSGGGGASGVESDPSLALLGSLESSSKQARLMRQGWRQAIQDRYEQNKAVARLAAVPRAVKFRIVQDTTTNTTEKTNPKLLYITFDKGVQGRGHYEEQVDWIEKDAVVQVISSIYPENQEALRPANLALLSPRMFWSIAYHAMQQQQQQQKSSTDNNTTTAAATLTWTMEQALPILVPSLDWSFLKHRKYTLSAKARENLRQKQEREQPEQEQPDWDAAAAAIESVERAMHESWNPTKRSTTARDNIQNGHDDDDDDSLSWQLSIPTQETNREELLECIRDTTIPAASVSSPDSSVIENWVDTLIQQGIPNVFVLATTTSSDTAEMIASAVGVEMDVVSEWIQMAREETMHEIMFQIVDQRPDVVELLQDVAQSGTPAELAVWEPIVEELRDILVTIAAPPTENFPSLPDLKRWCKRAQIMVQRHGWLEQFTTPISANAIP